jgi:hypothetical protein
VPRTDRRSEHSRVNAARRRAAGAKKAVAVVAVVGFGAAVVLARVSYAGHPKKPPRPLAAPPRFVKVVRENLLQAGMVAPAQASPEATTASS